ncbi:hypothetical protein QR680_012778 [Steinernema hermaphroditum]|uniref:Uncharacterized protein n=1 Tax=Steinernema hermaphroditum TaxID=289476 RepID=A0AA39M146_9BILA|nr:hypothetical protein QR680_012778 [Steinernema hermaphroditum]
MAQEMEVPATTFERFSELYKKSPALRHPDSPDWFRKDISEELKKKFIWAAPYDARFPQVRKQRQCFAYYVDFHRCQELMGLDYAPCKFFQNVYKDICPGFWVEKWDELRDEGRFPAKFDRMSSSTIVNQKELERRESYIRAYNRPRDLLDPFTWTYPWKGAGVMAALSVGTIHLHNLWMKKPWYFAVFPRAALVGVIATLGYGMGMLREHHYRTRDAVMEHYIQLHPEDFDHLKDYHGRPFSKILLPWYPRRTQYKQYDN